MDASEAVGINNTGKNFGIAIADFDLDGWEDLYVSRRDAPNLLYQAMGIVTSTEEAGDRGRVAGLLTNRPNPFQKRTTIDFWLAAPRNLRLQLLDLKGQRLVEIGGGQYPAGYHSVDWEVDDRLPAGLSFQAGNDRKHTDPKIGTNTVAPLTEVGFTL